MAKPYDHVTPELRRFIAKQQMFFVATAPSTGGHINLSPKGLDSFRVLSEIRVGYLDLTGSGNETSAHLEDNGRITFMFCAFDGAPKILRIYGKGRTVLQGTPEWDELSPAFEMIPGTRQLIVADVTRVTTSCGFAVPLYEYQGQRDQLIKYANNKGPRGLEKYRRDNNLASIDGLPTTLGKALAPE
jgi:hypothetical protein